MAKNNTLSGKSSPTASLSFPDGTVVHINTWSPQGAPLSATILKSGKSHTYSSTAALHKHVGFPVAVRGQADKDMTNCVHGPLCRAIRRSLCLIKPVYTRNKERKPIILKISNMPKCLEYFLASDLRTTRVPFAGLTLPIAAMHIENIDF